MAEDAQRLKTPSQIPARRKFFTDAFSTLGWLLHLSIWGVFGGCFARFLFNNVLFEPPAQFKAGSPNDYPNGTVSGRFKGSHNVWIVRRESGFVAMDGTCTHLGCKPNWENSNNKFKCPCHGSGFRMDGTNFEGPAPRALDRVRISLAGDGQLQIDKSMKFTSLPGDVMDEKYPESILRI